MNLMLLALLLTQTPKADVFVDRNETYVRAGTGAGLKVGQELAVIAKDGKPVGSAVTLEVWEALARVKLDPAAEAYSGPRHVVVGAPASPAEAAARLKDDPAPEEGDAAEAGDEPAEQPGAEGDLRGRATVIGFWQGKRLTVENKSSTDWHHCKLRLPDNRRYELGDLARHDSEGIMLFRFEGSGSQKDVPLDAVLVRCDEGSSKLRLSL